MPTNNLMIEHSRYMIDLTQVALIYRIIQNSALISGMVQKPGVSYYHFEFSFSPVPVVVLLRPVLELQFGSPIFLFPPVLRRLGIGPQSSSEIRGSRCESNVVQDCPAILVERLLFFRIQ